MTLSASGISARHFPAYIDGTDVDTDRVTYGINVTALIDNASGSDLWRRLLGRDPEAVNHQHVMGSVAVGSAELAERAVQAAAVAAPQWAAMPLSTRLHQLYAEMRRRVLEHADDYIDFVIGEGSPRPLAEWLFNIATTVFDERTAGWCADQLAQDLPSDGQRQLRLVRRPDGVVAVDPPRNAPISGGLVSVGALAAGNAVVLRAPVSVPTSVSFFAREIVAPALAACGAPPGTFNIVCGDQPTFMSTWLASPLVDTIFYFGTSARGKALERKCVAAGKKPILELSGNDGVLIWQDADLDGAVAALAECFLGSGQICMAPNYALVHPAIADELMQRLVVAAGEQRAGDLAADGVTLSPVAKIDAFETSLEKAVANGATLVCGGRRMDAGHVPSARGLYVEPTVLRVDGLTAAAAEPVVCEETFFPLLPVVVPEPGPDSELLDRLIDFMNANRYGLRNSLWSDDEAVINEFLSRIGNGGNIRVNDSHLSCPSMLPTMGGSGASGDVWGEANHPVLRTSRLQAIAIGSAA